MVAPQPHGQSNAADQGLSEPMRKDISDLAPREPRPQQQFGPVSCISIGSGGLAWPPCYPKNIFHDRPGRSRSGTTSPRPRWRCKTAQGVVSDSG